MSAKTTVWVLLLMLFALDTPVAFCTTAANKVSSKEQMAEDPAKHDNSTKNDVHSIFSEANHEYLNGNFNKAIANYQKVLQAGIIHPDLYYNLANAYYRSGQIGLAVLFYEKALALDPGDQASQSNLKIVQKELLDKVVMPDKNAVGEPLWHGFLRRLDLELLTWSFLGLWILVFAVLITRRLISNNSLRRILFWINVPLICIMLTFSVLLFSRIYIQEKVHHGIVITNTTSLREGPGRSTGVLMEIHAGLKVRLLNDVDNYVRIRLANGVEGFIPRIDLGRI